MTIYSNHEYSDYLRKAGAVLYEQRGTTVCWFPFSKKENQQPGCLAERVGFRGNSLPVNSSRANFVGQKRFNRCSIRYYRIKNKIDSL